MSSGGKVSYDADKMKDFLTKWSPPHVRDCRGTARRLPNGQRFTSHAGLPGDEGKTAVAAAHRLIVTYVFIGVIPAVLWRQNRALQARFLLLLVDLLHHQLDRLSPCG